MVVWGYHEGTVNRTRDLDFGITVNKLDATVVVSITMGLFGFLDKIFFGKSGFATTRTPKWGSQEVLRISFEVTMRFAGNRYAVTPTSVNSIRINKTLTEFTSC